MANKVTDFLLERNREQSAHFISPDAALLRAQYKAKHPTEIMALQCMDGRVHMPIMTDMLTGIITPMRAIGGKFDLGWPYFGASMHFWVKNVVARGNNALVLVTYHFSKGDTHRGCKGFGYNTDEARAFTVNLKAQLERAFGASHGVVYPIQVGVETDEDGLVFHGKNGQTLDTSEENGKTQGTLAHRVHALYPDMEAQMINDLVTLIEGNLRHVNDVRSLRRTPADMEHKEQIIAVGRGFDWINTYNKALTIGPFGYDLRTPIAVAANIILDNMKNNRIAESDGVALLVSATYREEAGSERAAAEEQARSLGKLALATLNEQVPEFARLMSPLIGTTNMSTRRFTPVELR